ncbi:hypothetical protein A2U01_0000496 [Trifolium medium]|uniref:Retrotransposon gag domain-containing protein n=1 Tax=Trifolium medium TaxID=97028 RepID=A0A392LXQ1_9FABA|nr:hypothetical protein [Trifolium medium]
MRKEICGIRQKSGETLHEYWERFKRLCARCPHHQISDQLLIQYFYEGLLPMGRSIVDAASGGALVDKTPDAARNLIENMAANAQQFGTRMEGQSKVVNEVHTSLADQQRVENRNMIHSPTLTTLVGEIIRISNMAMFQNHSSKLLDRHPNNNRDLLFNNNIKYNNQQPRICNKFGRFGETIGSE